MARLDIQINVLRCLAAGPMVERDLAEALCVPLSSVLKALGALGQPMGFISKECAHRGRPLAGPAVYSIQERGRYVLRLLDA